MKKITSLLVAMVMLLLVPVTALAEGNVVTSETAGFTDILFSNGYKGFCIDQHREGSAKNASYNETKNTTNVVNNNESGEDVSQKIKILFTQQFETFYVKDDTTGEYVIKDIATGSDLQYCIWSFTDNQSVWGTRETIVQKVNAYDGPIIPDEGYVLSLDNGDYITFYFMVMQPVDESLGVQDFFACKFEVSNTPTHVHEGGEATCVDKAICEECKESYGEVDKENHTGETELRNAKEATEEEAGYTGDMYCKSCDELIEKGEEIPKLHKHEGGEATCVDKAICEECKESYGEVDKENHVGDTELRDAKEATVEEPGYTGDVYCKSCDELIEKGKVIIKIDTESDEDFDDPSSEDTAEVEPEDSVSEDTASKETPETGDIFSPYLCLTVMLMSIATFVITLRKKIK